MCCSVLSTSEPAGVDRPALEELLLSLKRLDDFCLENRVIVFNVEDLEAVEQAPATHATWTVLKAGETACQTGELLST